MPRKGRLLEQLVQHFQEQLVPQGVVVQSPEEFRDTNGNKLGEIDVSLRGRFGTSRIFIGIECRDRPRDGPQGNDWITQIDGKKRLFGADRMIAVSSTGFTTQAIQAANQLSVGLLQVQNVEDAAFVGWFKTLEFAWQWDSYKIDGLVDIRTVPPIKATAKTSDSKLRSSVTGQEISFAECIQPGLDQIFATLPPGKEITDAPCLLNITTPLEVALEGQTLKVTQLLVPVRISREIVNAKALLNICHNLGEDRIEGLTGICRLHTRDQDLKVLVAATPSKSMADHYDLRVTVLGANDQPVPLPAGTAITLYGIKEESGERS